MSEAGLQIINDSGTFLISDKNPTLAFVAKGSTILDQPYTGPEPNAQPYWRGTPSLPSGYSACVLAVRSSGFFFPDFDGTTPRYGSDVAGTVIDWYMFARPLAGSGSGAGLQVFDEAGRCTYDSEQRVGKVVQVLNTPGVSAFGGVVPETTYTGPLFPSGKTYALVLASGGLRVAMTEPNPSGATAYYIEPMISCSDRVIVKERLAWYGTTDTDDRAAGGNTTSLIIDVTGY